VVEVTVVEVESIDLLVIDVALVPYIHIQAQQPKVEQK
jgi:hypothetical protein